MPWFQSVYDFVQLLKVDRWVDRAVMHSEPIVERLQEQLVVEKIWISKNQMRLRGEMFVEVVQPVD